jgi:hypothetical protein
MQNSTLKKLFSIAALCPLAMAAQPTLTASGINPVVGDVQTTHSAQYVSPGSSGANQTWNLAFTSSGSSSSTGVAPASTPYGSSFPAASVAFGPTTFLYYKTSSAAFQMNGVVNSAGTVIAYSDLEDMLRFPTAFNNTYTDTWAATFVQASYTYYREGTTTVTADAYGTLTTPAGTFTNVMRVHFVQTYQDSTNIMSNPIVITYSNDQYMWYLNGNHSPVASVYSLTTSSGGPFTGGYYLQNVVSGVEEQNAISALQLYPSVTSDVVNLAYTLNASGDVQVSLTDATGKLVSDVNSHSQAQGENTLQISVADLPDGVYFALITAEGNLPVTRKFVVAH